MLGAEAFERCNMTRIAESTRITLKNVLYLTDFSESSEAALPFAVAIASKYGATVHALHVLTPVIPETCLEAISADEKLAATAQGSRPKLTEMPREDFLATGRGVRAHHLTPQVFRQSNEKLRVCFVLDPQGG